MLETIKNIVVTFILCAVAVGIIICGFFSGILMLSITGIAIGIFGIWLIYCMVCECNSDESNPDE